MIFSANVSKQVGWHDLNKLFGEDVDGKEGDGALCWATAASNMIEWWLADYQSKGYTIPANPPHGEGRHYAPKVFEEFIRH